MPTTYRKRLAVLLYEEYDIKAKTQIDIVMLHLQLCFWYEEPTVVFSGQVSYRLTEIMHRFLVENVSLIRPLQQHQSYLPGIERTVIKTAVSPGRGSSIALRLS